MVCSITTGGIVIIFNIAACADNASLGILAIHCIDKSRNVALMPSGITIDMQAGILPQHIIPHHNIARGIEISEDMQPNSEMAISTGQHIHLGHYLIFQCCAMVESISECHVIAITIGPMVAIGRTGGTFLQRDRIERHPAPWSLGDYVMSLSELAIISNGLDYDMIRRILHGLRVNGTGFGKGRIGRLEAHTAIVSQSAEGCKCNACASCTKVVTAGKGKMQGLCLASAWPTPRTQTYLHTIAMGLPIERDIGRSTVYAIKEVKISRNPYQLVIGPIETFVFSPVCRISLEPGMF